MNVEETVERDLTGDERHEVAPEHRPSPTRDAAVIEAAYILEAVRK